MIADEEPSVEQIDTSSRRQTKFKAAAKDSKKKALTVPKVGQKRRRPDSSDN